VSAIEPVAPVMASSPIQRRKPRPQVPELVMISTGQAVDPARYRKLVGRLMGVAEGRAGGASPAPAVEAEGVSL
jgi:hypothetical protein